MATTAGLAALELCDDELYTAQSSNSEVGEVVSGQSRA